MKFRAIIDNVAYKFTLQDLIRCASFGLCSVMNRNPEDCVYLKRTMSDSTPWHCGFGAIPNNLKKVVTWLKEGNEPDRCTDRQDAKGNDIYENDIVRYTNYFDGKEWDTTTKVSWCNGGLYLDQGTLISCSNCSNNISDASNIIVIGNVHQNPELLEVKV